MDAIIVDWLKSQGHDVAWMVECEPGADDRAVAALALLESRVLVTFDRDFGDLVFRHGFRLAGVLYVRLKGNDPALLLEAFRWFWLRAEARLAGNFVVVSHGRMRVRPISPN